MEGGDRDDDLTRTMREALTRDVGDLLKGPGDLSEIVPAFSPDSEKLFLSVFMDGAEPAAPVATDGSAIEGEDGWNRLLAQALSTVERPARADHVEPADPLG